MGDLALCCTLFLLPLSVFRAALTFFLLARRIAEAPAPLPVTFLAFGDLDLSRFLRPVPLPGHPYAVCRTLRVLSVRLRSPPEVDDEDR